MHFDKILAIDWSGAKGEKTRSIAVASCDMREADIQLCAPHSGGLWSRQSVFDLILGHASTGRRILIGIDANLGYAASVARTHIGDGDTAFSLWERVDTLCADDANFYAEKFWTHPLINPDFWVEGKRPAHKDFPQRRTEQSCAALGFGSPENPFKFIGPKQVGKGGLAAMRLCHGLRMRLGQERLAFWPMSSPEALAKSQIVIAEIYPRLFIVKSGFGTKKIRNRADLDEVLHRLDGKISKQFEPTDHEADSIISACGMKHLVMTQADLFSVPTSHIPDIRLEGWILGVPL